MTTKAIVLAAGSGQRMRRADPGARLTPAQAAAADRGLKALVPVAGRPFLDHLFHALAQSAVRRCCLVVGPHHHDALRRLCAESESGLDFAFAVQDEPRGTADALLRAEDFAGSDPFLVMNSDNYYPPEVLHLLQGLGGPGLVGFDRRRFLERGESNVTAERMAAYAVLETDSEGFLRRIVEKPDPEVYASLPEPVLVSMSCWRFETAIFDACRRVPPSVRGELELPEAVGWAVERMGTRFRVVVSDAPVLDLSHRGDVAAVEARLEISSRRQSGERA